MNIRVIAVGRRMPAWVTSAWEEYAGRLPRKWFLELIEVAPEGRSSIQPERAMAGEAQRIQSALRENARVIVLDERGRQFRSGELAGFLDEYSRSGQAVDLIIGGADGVDPVLLEQAHDKWSLSSLTLPHAMVRVLLVEQIYRAWSIINRHPYHRD